jgi:hypothetical protein
VDWLVGATILEKCAVSIFTAAKEDSRAEDGDNMLL